MKKKIFVTVVALLAVVALLIVGTGCKDPIKVYVSGRNIGVDITEYADSGDVTVWVTDDYGKTIGTKVLNKNKGPKSVGFNVSHAGAYTVHISGYQKTVTVN